MRGKLLVPAAGTNADLEHGDVHLQAFRKVRHEPLWRAPWVAFAERVAEALQDCREPNREQAPRRRGTEDRGQGSVADVEVQSW